MNSSHRFRRLTSFDGGPVTSLARFEPLPSSASVLGSRLHPYRILLRLLLDELRKEAGAIPSREVVMPDPAAETATPIAVVSRNVFIAHGTDRAPALELGWILRPRWHLKPVLLELEPGESRPLIQKFERVAADAAYAFVLFTPDDLVQGEQGKYSQARPNVFFEAGWLFAHLTPERVCILDKHGAKIPTDLEGVTRIGFRDSVLEKVIQIEKELKAAGLIGRKK